MVRPITKENSTDNAEWKQLPPRAETNRVSLWLDGTVKYEGHFIVSLKQIVYWNNTFLSPGPDLVFSSSARVEASFLSSNRVPFSLSICLNC